MLGQISLNDFLSQSVHLGRINDKEKLGKQLLFSDLKNYVGKRVLYVTHSGNGELDCRVIIINDYLEKEDTFYSVEENGKTSYLTDCVYSLSSKETREKAKVAFVCDRLAYTDDDRTKKTNSWISEAYCNNGKKYPKVDQYAPVYFCEYKAI